MMHMVYLWMEGHMKIMSRLLLLFFSSKENMVAMDMEIVKIESEIRNMDFGIN